jgi:hypothetical protein
MGFMAATFGNEYEELHRLVDQLPVERVRALRALVVHLPRRSATKVR